MKKIVKWVLIIVLILCSVAGGVYYMNMPVTAAATQALPKTVEIYFTEQGVADVERTVEVYSSVPGRIESMAATENQTVREGDILCIVETAELKFQIAQIESNIKSYQAQMANLDMEEQKARDDLVSSKNSLLGELRSLDAQENASNITMADQIIQKDEKIRLQNIVIAQNEKELERAKDDLAKKETLFSAGGISVNEYTLALNAVETQENLLAQNKQQLQIIESGEIQSDEEYFKGAREALQAQINGIDAFLSKSHTGAMKNYYTALIEGGQSNIGLLNKKIEDSAVRAPVSGIITTLYIKDTNMVSAASPVAIITPDATCQIEVYVSTSDINEIHVGQPVEVILKRRSGDQTYPGVIKAVENEATVRLSVLGVEERRVKVTVVPTEGMDEIKKGYDADVKFVVHREDNKLAIPKTAFFVVNDKDMLWVVQDGKAVMTEVVKGRELRTEFVVESGLESGSWVINDADASGIREGVNVSVEYSAR